MINFAKPSFISNYSPLTIKISYTPLQTYVTISLHNLKLRSFFNSSTCSDEICIHQRWSLTHDQVDPSSEFCDPISKFFCLQLLSEEKNSLLLPSRITNVSIKRCFYSSGCCATPPASVAKSKNLHHVFCIQYIWYWYWL